MFFPKIYKQKFLPYVGISSAIYCGSLFSRNAMRVFQKPAEPGVPVRLSITVEVEALVPEAQAAAIASNIEQHVRAKGVAIGSIKAGPEDVKFIEVREVTEADELQDLVELYEDPDI
jgi:hypothetical protein